MSTRLVGDDTAEREASPGQIMVIIGHTAVGFRTVTGADDTLNKTISA